MTFTNQFIKVSVLATLCLLSYVLKIDAFSASPVVSALRSSATVLYQQILDVDDNNENKAGQQQEPPRPFFFTGEAKSESENRELRRVFMGAESLRSSSHTTIEEDAAAYIDADGTFLKGTVDEEGANGHVVNFDQERDNLERLFRL